MSDLVERLRARAKIALGDSTSEMLVDASAEIERLRADLALALKELGQAEQDEKEAVCLALEEAAALGDTLVSGQAGPPDYNKGLWDGIAKMQEAIRRLRKRAACA